MTSGKLIAFAGIDGSGKTTLINNVKHQLETEYNISTALFKDQKPFSPLGNYTKMLKDYLVKNHEIIDPLCEAVLMIAELGEKCISDLSNLRKKYQVIFSDRFIIDEEIYAHLKMGVQDARLKYAADAIGVIPDMTIYLDIDPGIAFKRIEGRGISKDWKESIETLKEAHLLYKRYLADNTVPNCITIDANKPQNEVRKDVLDSIMKLVGQE